MKGILAVLVVLCLAGITGAAEGEITAWTPKMVSGLHMELVSSTYVEQLQFSANGIILVTVGEKTDH